MRWSFSMGRVFGIPVKIHATLVAVLALLVWLFVDGARADGASEAWAWIAPTLLVIAVFASVLVHELGHALMARRYGVTTREIVLLPIGGVAMLEAPPDAPRQELWIALAGPLTSLALGLVALGLWALSRADLLLEVAAINGVLGVFNMVPAFPMDGGRVVRAVLAMRIGPVRATRVAARVGRVIAVGLVVVGLLDGQLMLALVGGFVFMAAGAEVRGAAVRHVLTTYRIADVMHRSPRTLSAAATTEDLSEHVASDPRSPAWPVLFGDRVLGVVHRDGLAIALAHGPREALDRNIVTTTIDTPLRAVIAQMNEARSRTAVILDARRAVVGVLSAERIAQTLRDAQGGVAAGDASALSEPASADPRTAG